VINAIKFAIEEIEASDQYFDHTWFSLLILRKLLITMVVVEIENDRSLRTGTLNRQLDRIDVDAW